MPPSSTSLNAANLVFESSLIYNLIGYFPFFGFTLCTKLIAFTILSIYSAIRTLSTSNLVIISFFAINGSPLYIAKSIPSKLFILGKFNFCLYSYDSSNNENIFVGSSCFNLFLLTASISFPFSSSPKITLLQSTFKSYTLLFLLNVILNFNVNLIFFKLRLT